MGSESWRLTVNEIDRSRTVSTEVGSVGACVIRAGKGKPKPVYINTRDELRILHLFGYPSVSYPDVWEAIQYNKEAPIRISAPYSSDAKYGGVLVTKNGSIPLTGGIDDPDNINFSSVAFKESVGTGDGTTLTFEATLSNLPYVAESLDIEIDGVAQNVTIGTGDTETITHTDFTGTLVKSTGALSITFTAAPATNTVIKSTYNSNQLTNAYFALFCASPCTDDTGVIVTYDTLTGLFKIKVYLKNNKSVYNLVATYDISITPNTFDGFGTNVYIDEVLEDNDYLIAKDNTLTFSTFTNDTTRVNFQGGSRGTAITSTELAEGWDYFKKKNTYPADIFMDFSADSSIPDVFNTLRNSYQKYKDYILPLPYTDDEAACITTKQGYSINNRGLAFYWNWGKIRDTYNNSSFWTSLIGKVGVKWAQMNNIYNGLAPCWIDENSHGGQLGSGIIELKHDPTEDELETLDKNGINAIVFDPVYGVMITSQRTAQSPGTLSDSSWIGHSRLFDYIIRNTLSQVLVYQITKLNDELHRQLATSLGQTLINPILSLNLLRDAIPKCDSENNTDDVLARREFRFTWGIKVTPFSETIIFDFVNVGQQVEVNEII